jgi:hypothetical protein
MNQRGMVQVVQNELSYGNCILSSSFNKGMPETVWNMLPPRTVT